MMCTGVSKSGSPAPSPMTSSPAAFISRALPDMAMVGDGLMRETREARKDIAETVSFRGIGPSDTSRRVEAAQPGKAARQGCMNSPNRHIPVIIPSQSRAFLPAR